MPADPTETAPARSAVPVAGIVLAAGTSSRMGSNKLLFEIGGESLLRRAVRQALAGGAAPLLVVLGHQAERAAGELHGLACQVVVNADYELGITSSLQAGVKALLALPAHAATLPDHPSTLPDHPSTLPDHAATPPAGAATPPAGAAVVMLADMPFITAEMIAALVARYRATTAPLVISDYQGVTAPPMLYDRALFGELLAMTGGRCGKQVVKRHRQEAEVLAWPAAALADLDVPEDYARLMAHRAADPGRT